MQNIVDLIKNATVSPFPQICTVSSSYLFYFYVGHCMVFIWFLNQISFAFSLLNTYIMQRFSTRRSHEPYQTLCEIFLELYIHLYKNPSRFSFLRFLCMPACACVSTYFYWHFYFRQNQFILGFRANSSWSGSFL